MTKLDVTALQAVSGGGYGQQPSGIVINNSNTATATASNSSGGYGSSSKQS